MLFGDVAREYRNLKAQLTAGQISEADVRARLEQMMIEDAEGKWWSIGYETGKWYYHDGQQWVRGEPPADKAATPLVTLAPTAIPDAVGASAPAEPPPDTAAIAAPVAAVSTASAGPASTKAPVATPRLSRPIIAAILGGVATLILVIAALVIYGSQLPGPDSAQNNGGTTAVSPQSLTATAAVVAVLIAPTPTPTQAPTSVPATATPPPEPTAKPSSTPTAIVPPTATSTPPPSTRTPTPEPPTPIPTATATLKPLIIITPRLVVPTLKPVITLVPGQITGFETFGTWVRGDQPHGTFKQSTEQAHSGVSSARLDYNFPAVRDNFVVFSAQPPLSIPGTPTALSIWVLGDGSGHFLNVWIQDNQGEVRSFHFGPVPAGRGWQQLTAPLDTTAPWPQGHISGPDNGKLDYPLRLHSIVLDSTQGEPSRGTIYLDDIMVARG